MNPISLSALSFAFGTFFIGFLVFVQRQDDIGRKWFLFCVTASLWSFFYGLWTSNLYDESEGLMLMQMSHVCSMFIPPTWMDFIFSFLGFRHQKRRLLFLAYATSFLLAPLVPTPYFLAGHRPYKYLFKYYVVGGPLYHIFTVLFFSCVTYAFVKTIQAYRSSMGERREQIKYLIWGTGIGFAGGSLTFAPLYGIDFPQYNVLIMPAYPFIVAYALTKHRLLYVEQIAEAALRDRLTALGLLSASINHEIRSPLFVIQGQAEILLESMRKGSLKALSEEEREKRIEQTLKKTAEQATRVVEITKRLTDFSKPAPGTDADERVNLNEVVDNVLSFVGYGLHVDNIQVEKIIPPNLALQANRKELEQILLNLVINASQAMEKKTGTIRFEAREGKGKAEIRIIDTGPGIPPDKLSHIFEPFFTTKESGTGLGLYITKQLVERNQGKISVESKVAEGTTFILDFRTNK